MQRCLQTTHRTAQKRFKGTEIKLQQTYHKNTAELKCVRVAVCFVYSPLKNSVGVFIKRPRGEP